MFGPDVSGLRFLDLPLEESSCRAEVRGKLIIVRVAYNFYVYLTTNKSSEVLYTGVTNDLQRRLWAHRNSRGRFFAARYNCHRLVYFEWSQDIRDAIAREKQIKGWSRAKKEALIATTNPEWKDLSAGWSG
jgi:putative endonuclease